MPDHASATTAPPLDPAEVYSFARAFARRGMRVFPVHALRPEGGCSCRAGYACDNPGKHPTIRNWQKLATVDPVQVARWFDPEPPHKAPPRNLGMATGADSGVFVLDVDPRHHGHLALEALEAKHGALPETWRFRTGGGGWHVLFAYPSNVRLPNSANKLGDGLDTRGDGGYIVAPPSIHASGGRYAIDPDHDPAEVALAPPPQWLIDLVAPAPAAGGQGGFAGTPSEEWVRLVQTGVHEGGRNTATARLAGHLLRRGVNPHVTLTLVWTWVQMKCTPPLDFEEVQRTVASVARREAQRMGGRR